MVDDASPTPPPAEAEVWNQQTLTMALRHCIADLGEIPSQHGYESWRTNQNDPAFWPPGAVIAAKGWRWQLSLAGPRYGRTRRSDVEVWAHVQVIRDQLGPRVTRPQYEAFRGANPQLRLASASTIRVRTGKKWSELFGTR